MHIRRQLRTVFLLAALLCAALQALPAMAVNGAFTETPNTPNTPNRAGLEFSLASCNRTDFQEIVQQQLDQQNLKASAVWLNRQLIQWQGVAISQQRTRFRLVSSRTAALVLAPGAPVQGADQNIVLDMLGSSSVDLTDLPATRKEKFNYLQAGVILKLPPIDATNIKELLRHQVILVQENEHGEVMRATRLQQAALLDDLYSAASQVQNLGVQVQVGTHESRFKLWAPTAQQVALCVYKNADGKASAIYPAEFQHEFQQENQQENQQEIRINQNAHLDENTGVWSWRLPINLSGYYYRYLVDVIVPQVGVVRNLVTDPYSISLSADSLRSYIADLEAPQLQPKGWQSSSGRALAQQTDMSVYELHVRDFSINDTSVPAAKRGKFLAFTEANSNGMRHLKALAQAGLSDVHLLPVFDFASVPERNCVTPKILPAAANGTQQQAQVTATASRDCFNWGYDPFHFNAPEGSYASNANNGAARIIEFRRMVMALHQAGLRVGMDVVYNHTAAAGQVRWSVLDRIVPGYYHRLNAEGAIEQSTCCDNTATENSMMGKLLIDSVLSWATHYKIDSFRFDLMAHQPRVLMERLQKELLEKTGRFIPLLGEGWNFGEVANGARFVQASQLSLNGTGIASFSDRARDALRGGGAADSGAQLLQNKGYINDSTQSQSELASTADQVKVGLAGSLRDYVLQTADGSRKRLEQIDYHGQPAGYVSQPGEVVNYVENHDNQTLFDINVYKLPVNTSQAERARVQILASAITALSQGIAYFHAGQDLLRSKSLDRNSFDSGDWFNRLDWRYHDNYFGSGLPPKKDNATQYPLMRDLLKNQQIKPTQHDIVWAKNVFQDFLKIRASSTLFRMPSASDIQQRLRFAKGNDAALITMHLDGRGYAGANFQDIVVVVNVARSPKAMSIDAERGKSYRLHPIQAAPGSADQTIRKAARYRSAEGQFFVPAQSVVVFVQP